MGSQSEVPLAQVSGYEIDRIGFAGHVVAIACLPEGPDHVDAIIGFPTIRQARWTVDVRARRWNIDN